MMAVNLQNNRLLLLTAYQQVIDEATDTDWALYTYEGDGNDLTISSSGGGGLAAITVLFDSSMVMYGFCSMKEPNAALPRYILINWVGEDVPDARKCACASHVATIAEFLQGVDVIINASSMEDIDPSAIGQRLTNGTTAGGVASPVLSRLKTREDEQAGTVYEKTNAEIEMKKINREEFWEQAKREEELRKEEEKKKLAEERQRFEEERMELERKEQEDREKRYRERERQIEEHRKKMQEEEEAKERQRNQPAIVTELSGDDLNADKKESEVDEAKAIIAQRSGNPREFFKLKERAMTVCVDSSPVSIHRTGRLDSPFLRQQHSPTSDPSSDPSSSPHPKTRGGGSMSPLRTPRPARTQQPPWAASDGDDTTEGSLDHGRMAAVSPIPKIVTTPINEEQRKDHEDDSTNDDWGSGSKAEPQESTPPRPVQSVAPQARDSAKFNVWESGTESLVEIWDSSQTSPSSPLADGMSDSPNAKPAAVSGPRPMPLLSFDDMADGSTCSGSGGADDEPSSLVAVAGGADDLMTLSYQQALQHAAGEGQGAELVQDAQRLITNGEALLKEGTQAGSEGYFSQSQEEEFGQTEECSAKHTPVFYNKPPEIDITCWDTDPVEDEDD